jgi:cardiolipin synthase
MEISEPTRDEPANRCHTVCHLLDLHRRCEPGNHLNLLSGAEEYVPAMLASITAAQTSVDLELYRFDPGNMWDHWFSVLTLCARRGVCVRLLADSLGSRRMAKYWNAVRQAGIKVQLTPSLVKGVLTTYSTRRDHRKLLVVDREVAFTGGMSVDDTFFRPANEPTWRESMVEVRGPVANEMQRAFDKSWSELEGRVSSRTSRTNASIVAGGSNARLLLSTPRQATGESLFISAISGATQSIFITNPYVIPSANILAALIKAARAGIEVRLLVPAPYRRFGLLHEAMRGFYTKLLRSGVRVFEYEAGMLHAKTITVDEQWASVGSFNMDSRSFFFNDEMAVAACDPGFARSVAAAFIADSACAREVKLALWQRRGIGPRFREALVALVRNHL